MCGDYFLFLPQKLFVMIGKILGLGAGLAGGIMGGIKSSKAAKAQQKLIDQQRAKNDAWYNRNYYQNYLDSKEAQSAIKRVEDTMRRRKQEAQATAAVTGGTQEAVLAQEENDQKLMGDVVGNLATRGDAIKRQVDAQKQAMDNDIMGQQMKQYQMNEAGGSALMAAGLGMVDDAISALDGDKSLNAALNLFGGKKEGKGAVLSAEQQKKLDDINSWGY